MQTKGFKSGTSVLYKRLWTNILILFYVEKSNIVCCKVGYLFIYLLYQNQNSVWNLFMELTFCGKGEMEEWF